MLKASALHASPALCPLCTACHSAQHTGTPHRQSPCRQTFARSTQHRRCRLSSSRSRGHVHAVCAAGAAIKDPYKVLGVDTSADDKLIKSAFKQKAKQLHPDVNKAPDAADRFMECKMAYQLLIDPSKRQQYDRQHQAGFDWGDFVDGIASGGAKQRKQDTGEPFYGFTDFLRDLDVDLKRWSEQVDKNGFKSLFDELYDAGLLAVGALEKGLGMSTEEKRKGPSTASSSGAAASASSESQRQQPPNSARTSRPPAAPQDEAEVVRQKVQAFEREAEQKKQQAEKEVDDMLADLKKRLKER